IPESTIYHVGGGTLPKENPFKTYLNFRNNLFLLYKNILYTNYKRIIRIRKFLDYIAMGMYFFKGDIKNAKAIRNAHKDFNNAIPSLKEKRKKNHRFHKRTKHAEILNTSILFQKYILRKKKITMSNL
ncbi:MAG: glycosyltransferase family 2 protein, partial [Crenarchaeota archaeon]|nr:glycosyltransferase family 2 protein [Thermoproteota archaeon]